MLDDRPQIMNVSPEKIWPITAFIALSLFMTCGCENRTSANLVFNKALFSVVQGYCDDVGGHARIRLSEACTLKGKESVENDYDIFDGEVVTFLVDGLEYKYKCSLLRRPDYSCFSVRFFAFPDYIKYFEYVLSEPPGNGPGNARSNYFRWLEARELNRAK